MPSLLEQLEDDWRLCVEERERAELVLARASVKELEARIRLNEQERDEGIDSHKVN